MRRTPVRLWVLEVRGVRKFPPAAALVLSMTTKTLAAGLCGIALTSMVAAGAAPAHPGGSHVGAADVRALPPRGFNIPIVQSSNVRLVATMPTSRVIAGIFSPSAPYFYTSGLDSIQVFDVTDPSVPKLVGGMPMAEFENEAMTYGERRSATGQVVTRFVLVGVDGANVTVDRNGVKNGGRSARVIVVDVTDPLNVHVRGSLATAGDTHTVKCLSVTCERAYSSGGAIVDLTDLDSPRQTGRLTGSPAGGGHYWDVDDEGIAWLTGSNGTAAYDVTDPDSPRLLASTNADGNRGPWNDFIHHNSMRPHAERFEPGKAPSVYSGNVALITEEDYVDTNCRTAGSFQSWYIPEYGQGKMVPLDIINPSDVGEGLSTPHGGFCSAHWTDFHESGIVAQGYYQQGLRFIDVRDPRDIKEYGFFVPGAGEVWDAYWVPERDASGAATGRDTNLVYAVDAVRGIDVVEIDLPPAP